MPARILLIEDDASLASALGKILQDEGYDVAHESRGDSGLTRAVEHPWELVITDLKLPGLDGLELIRRLNAARPRLPIILMTAHGTTETAIEATKLGAFDYVLKPCEPDELLDLVAAAVANSQVMFEPVELGEAHSAGSAIIGNSRIMQAIYKDLGRVAATPVTVLIRGETGTGKELIARAIYQHGDRAERPFIAVNCAAIPDTLLESELFGHERGAFTGAHSRRIGRFEQANGGTIFLDEIGDLSPVTQAKLLRVLQEHSIQRLGGDEVIPVNARVLAATNRDLEEAIKAREFREDLYFRLSVVTIQLPPLRERIEDIPDLVRYFIRKYAPEFNIENPSIQSEALTWLQTLPWPGNVRELENVTRQALLLARPFPVSQEHVAQVVNRKNRPAAASHTTHADYIAELLGRAERGEETNAFARMVADLEAELYQQAFRHAHGNQARIARWLGVTRLKVRQKLREFGLHPGDAESRDCEDAAG